nr:MAG TPA: hypothetical protein [Caudoviricetes sp.]
MLRSIDVQFVNYKCEVLGRNRHIGDAMFIASKPEQD